MTVERIPRFYLYGEPPRTVGDRFLHLETLEERTLPANWNIRPHTHANLSHLFHVTTGGGTMLVDARRIPFQAPCLLIVPAGLVHGFTFEIEARGSVLTLSEAYLHDLAGREPAFRRVFADAARLPLPAGDLIARLLERLSAELAWEAPGHAAAVEALLITLLVEALRLAHDNAAEPRAKAGGQAALVARFREMIERRHRTESRVEAYAEALGVAPRRLRAACLNLAGASPVKLIHARLTLEAKRLLLYSNMTVAETAYYLGFDDPAYFTRFFTRECGLSPTAFRRTPTA